ncbi:MAG: hypothetical protein JSS81_28330, partial [Acidobacteria bacterium]|nr:hypothetical protein [Acidobacteriota bacterium]
MTPGSCDTAGPIEVESSGGTTTPTAYATLGGAFGAINAGTHTGTITIDVCGDSSEGTTSAALNASGSGAASYTAITISPAGGAARTISGATTAGSPLIDFNGADNVTINGLNSGGNSLTISNTTVSSTSGTSTIRFQADATGNTLTNASILGSATMSTTTNGGVIWFAAGAVSTGNDNNTISSCNIGPAGSNLPTKGIYGNGTTTTTALNNSNNTVSGNNIFDYFGAAVSNAGIYLGGGNTAWTISNNKFYQTATRTITTGSTHAAIYIANTTSADGFAITGNTIGYASNAGTGTYTIAGALSNTFYGIYLSGLSTSTTNNISGNTISDISFTTTSTGTTAGSYPFAGINLSNGASSVTLNNNIIRNVAFPSTGTGSFAGIDVNSLGTGTHSVNGNTVNNLARTTNGTIYGIKMLSPTTITLNNNTITNLALNSTTATSAVYGIYGLSSSANVTANGNTITNLTSTSTGGVTIVAIREFGVSGNKVFQNNIINNLTAAGGATINGIHVSASSSPNPMDISGNTINTLSGGAIINGIQQTSASTTVNIYKNKIYDLSTANTNPSVAGILVSGGTTDNIYNNLVGDLRTTAANAANPLIGLSITGSTNANAYYNTVYLNGSSTGALFGSSAVSVSTTPVVTLRNNVFVNASTTAGAGLAAAYRRSTATLTSYGAASNNNDFFGSTIYTDGTNTDTTIGAYKTRVASRDSNSFTENPPFLSTTGASSNFLHINTATSTQLESGGAAVSGITDDFDGDTRNATTPDVGADEFAGLPLDLSAPTITYAALANTASTTNRNLAATISDSSGVAGGGLAPRIYFKKSTDAGYVSTQCTGSSPSFTCQIDYTLVGGGSVAINNIIQYFVVAQDTAGNLAANPSTGFTGTNVNTVTTPPTTPNSYTIVPSLSGSFTVGAGGDYNTLTDAVTALNGSEITGPVVMELTDPTYTTGETFPLTINANNGSSATNTVVIKPSVGVDSVISGAVGSGCLIKLNGIDYLTIDGSNSGGSSRNLTISNTSTTSPAAVCISSLGTGQGATNDTVKNTNISTGLVTTAATAGYGISVGGGTAGTAGADNDFTTLQNNNVTVATVGIFAYGTASTSAGGNDSLTIAQNTVDSTSTLQNYGIEVGNALTSSISGNTVSVETSGAFSPAAISIETGFVSSTVTANKVTKALATNTGGYGGRGITVGTGTAASNLTIANNVVYGVNGSNWNAFGNSSSMGIAIGMIGGSTTITTTAGGINLYYNSVSMTGSMGSGSTTAVTAALYVGSSATALDIRDNVFSNTQVGTNTGQKNYGIYSAAANTAFTTINYNDYYAANSFNAGSAFAGFLTSDRVDLAAIQTGFGQNLNSLVANPNFNSATNLQPQTGSPVLAAGTPIGAVTTDFAGTARNATTPSIGAYETAADTAGPAIVFTDLTDTGSTANRTLTAAITDPSGVASGAVAPRIYFKKSTDAAYVSTQCVLTTTPNYDCTIDYTLVGGGSVAAGDTIQYFVVAQDLLGNLGSSPSGAVGTSVNAITTNPTPKSYGIQFVVNVFPYSQDFEAGTTGWTAGVTTGSATDWVYGTPAKTQIAGAHSGTKAWVTKLTGTYTTSTTSTLTSPIIDMSSLTGRPTLSFWHNFKTETGWDAGILEYSTNGGSSWTKVDATLGTGGTFNTTDSTGWYNSSSTNGPISQPKWSNTSTAYTGAAAGWIQSTTLLPVAVVGQPNVRLRWTLGADSLNNDEGWAIDDVSIVPPSPGVLQFSSATYGGNENSNVTVTVTRTGGTLGAVAVNYATSDGTATGGAACGSADYVSASGTLNWADGDSASKTFTVQLCSDAVIDPAETVNLTLSGATGATIGATNPAVLTITDVPPPISGTFNIPGDYPSLTNPGGIFEVLNTSGASGNVTINIAADLTGETGSVALNQLAGGYSVTIKPTGAARSITGTGTGTSVIKLNGADNVTIDGSLSGGTDRSLTLNNTSTATGSTVLFVGSAGAGAGAANVTIKNCVIQNGTVGSTSVTNFGIFAGDSTGAANGADNDNLTIQNNRIIKTTIGIQAVGGATAGQQNDNTVIDGNTIGDTVVSNSIGRTGLFVGQTTGGTISRNTIQNVVTTDSGITSSNNARGISVSTGVTNFSVVRNSVTGVRYTSTGGYAGKGIDVNTGNAASNLTIANNFVSDIRGDGWNSLTGDSIVGLRILGTTGGVNIYNNSVNLGSGSFAGNSSGTLSAAFYADSTVTALDVRNNVFATNLDNTAATDKSYAVATTATSNTLFAQINYNDYFVSGAAGTIGLLNAIDSTTLAAWQTASGQDANSKAVDPQFTSATDLHLGNVAGNGLIAAGTAIAAVTVDIDNDPRPAANPEIGADEIVQSSGGSFPAGTFYNAAMGTGDTLAGNVTITNNLTLGGLVDTGMNTLTIDCNAAVTGAGGSNYVVGTVEKQFCATGSFSFPVGTTPDNAFGPGAPPEFTPVDVNVTAGGFPVALTATVTDGVLTGAHPLQSVSRYWDINKVGAGALTADLTFHYLDQDVAGTETSFNVLRRSGGMTAIFPGSTVNDVANTATAPNVSAFSQWGVGLLVPTA